MYHGIPSRSDGADLNARVFERQIVFLKEHFKVVSPHDVGRLRTTLDRVQVAVTFDDGFRNHAEVAAPILRRYRIPALFFISSRHSKPGCYLWFSYLRALEKYFRGNGFSYRGKFIDMSPLRRSDSIHRLRNTLLNLEPHPSAMYAAIENELPRLEEFVKTDDLVDNFAGMTEEQVRELASDPLFSIGIHTVDHPFLTKCGPEQAYRQIAENKVWIEAISNKSCDSIAYPLGDYDSHILQQCEQLGIRRGYAVIPSIGTHPDYEFSRVGVFEDSLGSLGFKVQWGKWVRSIQTVTGKKSVDFDLDLY